MEIRQTEEDHFITLQPKGELDANSSVQLDSVIRKLVDAGKVNIHVDFGGISYISSAGMGVFISYLEEIQALNGKIVLSHMSESVYDVFDLLGLNQLISIVSDLQAAKKEFVV